VEGDLWFTNVNKDSIGRSTPTGNITDYADGEIMVPSTSRLALMAFCGSQTPPSPGLRRERPSGSSHLTVTSATYTSSNVNGGAITAGPDGALWFINAGETIGRITIHGVVTVFPDPTMDGGGSITVGPDGALWYTNYGNNTIGRMTTKGVVTNYTDPTIDIPGDITAGPDGNLWFTNTGNNTIGRITTSGAVTNYNGLGIDRPGDITEGRDGALWFTNGGNRSIGRITTAGVVTNYTGAAGGPIGIT
jgi:virginiamycin B lyase